MPLLQLKGTQPTKGSVSKNCEPIIEEPDSPEHICIESLQRDIEDTFYEDPEDIPIIKLSLEDFKENLKNHVEENNMEIQDGDISKALVAISAEATSIPMPKLKNVNRLQIEHQVYELSDAHPFLEGMDQRLPDDPCPYLLAIWTPENMAVNYIVTQIMGGKLEEREPGKTFDVCFQQMKAFADNITSWTDVVIAYETVWAIGTGKVATPQQAQKMHIAVRDWLKKNILAEVASATRIIHGGSVKGGNSAELAKAEDVDSFLVGGAAYLKSEIELKEKSQKLKASASCIEDLETDPIADTNL